MPIAGKTKNLIMAIYDKLYYGCAQDVNMNGMDMLCPDFHDKDESMHTHDKNAAINNTAPEYTNPAAALSVRRQKQMIKGHTNPQALAASDPVGKKEDPLDATIKSLKQTDQAIKGVGKALSSTNKFRIGDNYKIYLRTNRGGIFDGNKHVKVSYFHKLGNTRLDVVGNKLQKASANAGYAFDAIDIGQGVIEDGGSFGYNAQKATAGAVGRAKGKKTGAKVGAKAGAKAGVKLGAKIGLIGGPKGVAVGAAIGGVIGGISGAIAGSSLAKKAAEKTYEGVRNVAQKTFDGARKAGKAARESVTNFVGGLFN